MSRRAVAPVIGVVLLVLVTVLVAAVVGTMAFGVDSGESSPTAAITGEADGNEIELTHRSGDALDVTELRVRVFVEGEPLEKQPTLPSGSGMDGFRYVPSGPFHGDSDNRWTAGETGGFTIASTTNAPQPDPGDPITVRIYANDNQVTAVRMTA